jgi:hypothetical protein
MAVAGFGVPVDMQEVVFGELEDYGDEDEEFAHDRVVDVSGEGLDDAAIGCYNLWVRPFVCGDEFGDVVDFCVVEDAGGDFLCGQD